MGLVLHTFGGLEFALTIAWCFDLWTWVFIWLHCIFVTVCICCFDLDVALFVGFWILFIW